jgi:hypothetical protein
LGGIAGCVAELAADVAGVVALPIRVEVEGDEKSFRSFADPPSSVALHIDDSIAMPAGGVVGPAEAFVGDVVVPDVWMSVSGRTLVYVAGVLISVLPLVCSIGPAGGAVVVFADAVAPDGLKDNFPRALVSLACVMSLSRVVTPFIRIGPAGGAAGFADAVVGGSVAPGKLDDATLRLSRIPLLLLCVGFSEI